MKTKKSRINFLNALQSLDTKNIVACIDFADYFVHNIVNIEFPQIVLEERELRECGVLKENENYNQHTLNQPGSTVYFVKYQKFLGYEDIGINNLKKLAELRLTLFNLDEIIPNNKDKKRQFASTELASYMRAIDTLKHAAAELYNKSRLLGEYTIPNENQDEAATDFIVELDDTLEKKLTLTIKARCQNAKENIENQLALRNQDKLFIHTMSKLWLLYEFLIPPKSDFVHNLTVSSYDDYTLSIFEEALRDFGDKFSKNNDACERIQFLDFSTTLNDYIKIISKKTENNRMSIANEFATVLALLERFNDSMTSEDKKSCIDVLELKKQELIFENSLYEIETITEKDGVLSNIADRIKEAFHGNGEQLKGSNAADSISSNRKTIISLLSHLYRLIGIDYNQAINDLNSRHFQLQFKKIHNNELIWSDIDELINHRLAEDFDNKLEIISCSLSKSLAVELSISNEINNLVGMLNYFFCNEKDVKKRMQLIKIMTEVAKFLDSKNSSLERDRVLNALASSEAYNLRTNFPQIVAAIEGVVSAYGKSISRFIDDIKSEPVKAVKAVNRLCKSYKAYAQREFSLIDLQSKLYEAFRNNSDELKKQNKDLLSQLPDKESYTIFCQQKTRYFEAAFTELNLALGKVQAKKSDFSENNAVLECLNSIIDAISSYCMLESGMQYNNGEVVLIYQSVLKHFTSLLSSENKEKLQLFITEVIRTYYLRYDSGYFTNAKQQYTSLQYPLAFSPEEADKIFFGFNIDLEKLKLFKIALGKIKKPKKIIEDETSLLGFHDYLSMGYFSHLSVEISQNFIKKEFKSKEAIPTDYFESIQTAICRLNPSRMQIGSDSPAFFLNKMLQAMELHNQKITQSKDDVATNNKPQLIVRESSTASTKEPKNKWTRRLVEGGVLLGMILVGIIALGTPVGWVAIAGAGLWLGLKLIKKSVGLIISSCKKNPAIKQPQPENIVRSVSEIGRGPINSSKTELDRKNQGQTAPATDLAWLANKDESKTRQSWRIGCFYQQRKKQPSNSQRAVNKPAISCVSGG